MFLFLLPFSWSLDYVIPGKPSNSMMQIRGLSHPNLGFLSSPQNNSNFIEKKSFNVVSSFNGSFFSNISMKLFKDGIMIQQISREILYPTGGNILFDGEWRTHKYLQSGTGSFSIPLSLNSNAEYLVVGGGGGGGFNNEYCGGGGGGGGFVLGSIPLNQGSIQVKVGAGGLGSSSKFSAGGKGGDSSIGSVIAYGGGGGGSGVPYTGKNDVISPTSGASGGGGGSQSLLRTKNGAVGISGQGHSGGNGYGHDSNCIYQGAGGGGGAGSAGNHGTSGKAGAGGAGKEYLGVYYSAGGGGGKRCGSQGAGLGGSGVGGNGGLSSRGGDAYQNSGSGGGGAAGGATTFVGGNGASGIVIIRYTTSLSLSLMASYSNLQAGLYEIVLMAEMIDMSKYSSSLSFRIISNTKASRINFKHSLVYILIFVL